MQSFLEPLWRQILAVYCVFAIVSAAGAQDNTSQSTTNIDEMGPFPDILYSENELPHSVLKTRNELLIAARSGNIENLRPIIERGGNKVVFSFESEDDDPIAYWKSISNDGTGRNVLAELIKILSSGFVHMDAGTPSELYVWPYHFMYPLSQLTPAQEVELYLLVPGEYRSDLEEAGGYIGFRAGIGADGTLQFFVSGE